MPDKILCPWCGTEMRSVLELVQSRTGRNIAWNAWMRCPNWDCQVEGPFMQIPPYVMKENADEKLRAATLRRYTPPIKPMTFEEVERLACLDSVYDETPLYLEDVDGDNEWKISYQLRRLCFKAKDDYGKTWRCWSRKPTDEERSAAEWET